MSNCLACELSVKECICSAVDAFFGSTLPTRAPEPVLVALPTPDQTWFIRPAKAMAALLAVCLVGTSCGALKGKDGASGAAGKDGVSIVGHTGAVGPKGDSGQTCTTAKVEGGVKITCPDGTSQTVLDGAVGPVGPMGLPGVAGTNSSPCQVAPIAGGVRVSCPDGSNQDIHDGSTGAVGSQGVAGSPGTVITPIEFCPNQGPTVYPSYFPEYGLKVGNVIYAVYFGTTQGSPNVATAFLAQIPAGAYQSTGGYACNFTVNQDGSITED